MKVLYRISLFFSVGCITFFLGILANQFYTARVAKNLQEESTYQNYSADRRKLDSLANKEQDKLLTEEQLKGIAIEYAKKVLLPKEELVTKKILVEEEQNKELNYRKVTIYEANKEYDIFIKKEDGEVCGLGVK